MGFLFQNKPEAPLIANKMPNLRKEYGGQKQQAVQDLRLQQAVWEQSHSCSRKRDQYHNCKSSAGTVPQPQSPQETAMQPHPATWDLRTANG